MDKQALLDALQEERDLFLESVEGLPDQAWVQPGVVGEWSVKDIVVHLSRWEAELIGMLHQAQQARPPVTAQMGSESRDALNARWIAASQARPIERIVADFQGVRDQAIQRVQALSEEDLGNPSFYPWLGGRPLSDWIAKDTVWHEAEHRVQIKAWRSKLGV